MKTDLRVTKTKKIIAETFKQMICETDYKNITIKNLCERALISRKTFYLHYQSIEDLLENLQTEVIDEILPKKIDCTDLKSLRFMIEKFFDAVENMPILHEKLLCSGSYRFLGEKINLKAINKLSVENRGNFKKSFEVEDLFFSYIGTVAIILYRKWISGGKKISLDDMKEITYQLLANGISKFI